jgi:hypothetical protein
VTDDGQPRYLHFLPLAGVAGRATPITGNTRPVYESIFRHGGRSVNYTMPGDQPGWSFPSAQHLARARAEIAALGQPHRSSANQPHDPLEGLL